MIFTLPKTVGIFTHSTALVVVLKFYDVIYYRARAVRWLCNLFWVPRLQRFIQLCNRARAARVVLRACPTNVLVWRYCVFVNNTTQLF